MPLTNETTTCGRCGDEFTYTRVRKPRKYCNNCTKARNREVAKHRQQKPAKNKQCQHCGPKPVEGVWCDQHCEDMSKKYRKHMAEGNRGFWDD